MKKFTYINTKTGKIIFESVEPNFVSRESVDVKVKEKTGRDPRLEPHLIECQIRVITQQEVDHANEKQNRRKHSKNNTRYNRSRKDFSTRASRNPRPTS